MQTPSPFNPYAPPVQAGGAFTPTPTFDFYRDGKDLVVRKDSTLPDVCLATGERTGGHMLTKKLSWIPPWTIVLFVVIRLIGLICMLVFRKSAMLSYAMSPAARAKRKQGIIIGLSVLAVGLVAFAMAVPADQPAFMILGLVATITGIVLAAVLHRAFTVRKIDDTYVHLRVKPHVLDAFDAYRAQFATGPAQAPGHSPFA